MADPKYDDMEQAIVVALASLAGPVQRPRRSGDTTFRVAVKAAAEGAHQRWWDHDDQNGHTSRDWRTCLAWPCHVIASELEDLG